MGRRASTRIGFVASCLLLVVSAAGRAEAPSALGRADLALPADPLGGEIIAPYGTDVPPACEDFLRAAGGDWIIVWDRYLGTPRTVFPASPRPLFSRSGGILTLPAAQGGTQADRALSAAAAFVEEHAGFFGVSPGDLRLGSKKFADGHLVSGYQVQAGLPIRGTAIRVRLDAFLALRSVSARVARELPAISSPALAAEEAAAAAAAEGLAVDSDHPSTLQIAFPGGREGAAAAWAVPGRDSAGNEIEALHSATTGARLLWRKTALHFDADIEGSLSAFAPPPEDMFALPSEISETPQALARRPVELTGNDQTNPGNLIYAFTQTDEFGVFNADLPGIIENRGYHTTVSMSVPRVFEFRLSLPAYKQRKDHFQVNQDAEIVYNPQKAEFEGFHLMLHQHLLAADRQVKGMMALQELEFNEEGKAIGLILGNEKYEHRYEPRTPSLHIHSDERMPLDERGLYRKIVPTIIYHEFGHHVFQLLTGSSGEKEVNDGVADALSTFISRISTVGFVDPVTPNADPFSRDLKEDTTAFPDEARRTVAGAWRELWEKTLDTGVAPRPGQEPESPFAYGLLMRWLASQHVGEGDGIGVIAAEFTPLLGIEVFVEADARQLKGDEDLLNGIPKQVEFLLAFGRRNLFPHAFIRGDANGTADIDLSDPMTVFGFLFLGQEDILCPDALDTDDSGGIDISDGISLLMFLFAGGSAPAAPVFDCGWDVTSADGLGCFGGPCTYFPEHR